MNLCKIINKILHIPRDLHRLNNVSVYSLLRGSGYFEAYSLISTDDIKAALVSEPNCVDEWLVYSEDKRCDSGWYFMRKEKHEYVVGYYPPYNGSCTTYSTSLDACAVFIKKEIEDIRCCI